MAEQEIEKQTPPNRRGNPNWVKGISGNPNGRLPKSQCVSSLLRDLLEGDAQRVADKWKKNHLTGAMIVAMALFKKMGSGDLTAIHEGLNRVEGRAPQEVTLAGKIEHKHEMVKFDNADLTDAFRALLECGAIALGNN